MTKVHRSIIPCRRMLDALILRNHQSASTRTIHGIHSRDVTIVTGTPLMFSEELGFATLGGVKYDEIPLVCRYSEAPSGSRDSVRRNGPKHEGRAALSPVGWLCDFEKLKVGICGRKNARPQSKKERLNRRCFPA